ncbi:hypothetical protein N7456_007108 [Penicillium angulare]|uniref:Uncharacterized protein n=1 Tax=Penicillium angulare TaxID=116970 RepID=A0A9W9KCT5_9EURO|nr:hypothetical protein N7456_007108 [Penicillium angulare]
MTGRASGLGNSFFSAPPPLASKDQDPFTNGAPNAPLERLSQNPPMTWTMNRQYHPASFNKKMDATNELYFFCLTDLIVISHTESTRVYSTDSVKQGWDEIGSRIDFYIRKMLEWRSGLPDSIRFEVINPGTNISAKDAYRISLAMHYHSSRIILNRPCLTRKKKGGKSDVKNRFFHARNNIETTCLDSALAMVSIFPDEPGADWLRFHHLAHNISLDGSSRKQRSQVSTSNSSNSQSLNRFTILDSTAIRTAAN